MVSRDQQLADAGGYDIIDPVPTTLAKKGHWYGNPHFGQRFQGNLSAIEGAPINLVDSGILPGEPAPWMVHLFRSKKNVANEASPAQNADVRARITWGVGGVSNTFDCDWINGTQFQIPANTLRIDFLGFNPCPSNGPYTPGPGLILGAGFGRGSSGNPLPPTFTDGFHDTDAGSGDGPIVDLIPPDLARSFCFHTDVADPTTLAGKVFLFFSSPGTTVKTLDVGLFYTELQREKGLALPAGVNQVRMDAVGFLPGTFKWALQWFLSL